MMQYVAACTIITLPLESAGTIDGVGEQMELIDIKRESRLELLCLGAVITLAYLAIPSWLIQLTWRCFPEKIRTIRWFMWYRDLLTLAFALLLTCGSWKRSGIRFGAIKQHWGGVLLVCGIPIALTAIIYPFLPERPFSNMPILMWVTFTLSF